MTLILFSRKPKTLVLRAFLIKRKERKLQYQWYHNFRSYLKTNPDFNTNAPPFEVRGCKVILGGAFLGQGGAKNFGYKAIQAN